MTTKPCPVVPRNLVEYLQEAFPDRAVHPDRENASIVFGQASVIRHLAHKLKEQDDGA